MRDSDVRVILHGGYQNDDSNTMDFSDLGKVS